MELFITRDDRVVSERRRAERIPSSGTAVLEWLDASSRHRTITAHVRNISTEGMMLELPQAVEPQLARVSGMEWQCIGWVRYCNHEDGKFVAGFQFAQKPYQRDSNDRDD